jgi:outer membrane protein assembly factor BamD (BamD/ComL family)
MKTLVCSVLVSAVVVAGCSKPTAGEYFARAEHAYSQAQRQLDTLKNQQFVPGLFTPVLESFETVIKEYPASAEAETSMFLVATIQNNELHQPQPAINAYRRFLEHYPFGKQAPLAMFMTAYLYNNELHELDSAGAMYRLFLEKYPNSEMAPSAKFELETLGKSPEELIPRTVAAEKPVRQPSKKTSKKSK